MNFCASPSGSGGPVLARTQSRSPLLIMLQEMACPKNFEWLVPRHVPNTFEGHVPRAGLSSDHSRDCPLIIQAGGICQGQQNWPTVFGTLFGSRSASKHFLQAMQIYDPFLLGCGRRIFNQLPSLRACFVGGLSPIHYMEASR